MINTNAAIVYYSPDRIYVRGVDGTWGYYTEEQCDKYLHHSWREYIEFSSCSIYSYENIGQL